MNIRPPFWSRLTWLLTLAALLAGGAWLATGQIACGALTALLGLGACAAAWFGADELADDLGSADVHPLDPHPEKLRRLVKEEAEKRRLKLAMGRMRDRPDDELEERGL